jgi:hypothetical protein
MIPSHRLSPLQLPVMKSSKQISRTPVAAVAILSILVACMAETSAESPYSVVSVNPSNPVLHGLEVKTPLDQARRWISLRGPEYYSSPDQTKSGDVTNYLTWYQIRKPAPEPVKKVQLSDQFSGRKSFTVSLGSPAFYLIPSQTVKDGPPSEIPEDLDHYVAFQIVDVDSVMLPEPTPGKPAFVCVPAEQFHHADHVPIKAASVLLMVYEVEPKTTDGKITTIDQFGLNALRAKETRFVYGNAKRRE